jgi:excisionase family DNA binding protein
MNGALWEITIMKKDKEGREYYGVRMETFLTVDELSEKLKVSKVWLCKLVREKRIPFYHVERCVRFSPFEI